MEHRLVGRSDISVSQVGLGCVTFGREIDEELSFKTLDHALSNDINLLDTAEAYGGGNARLHRLQTLGVSDVREKTDEMHSSEKTIGRWIASRRSRNRIVLQTKISGEYTASRIEESIDGSLKRLRTDHIDIYLLHNYSHQSSLTGAIEALDRAVQSGKIRVAGCSNFSSRQIRDSLAASERTGLSRFEAVQCNYNLVSREIEKDVIPLCRAHNVSVITYSPLGAGFLTGKYPPDREAIPKGSRFDVKPGHIDIYFHQENFRLLERLRLLSRNVGIPMARLSLGWALQNPDLTSVLIGATSLAHVDNGIEALGMSWNSDWTQFILHGEGEGKENG